MSNSQCRPFSVVVTTAPALCSTTKGEKDEIERYKIVNRKS